MKKNEIPLCKEKKPKAIKYRYFSMSWQYSNLTGHGFMHALGITGNKFPSKAYIIANARKTVGQDADIIILNIQELSKKDYEDFIT
jgi:hypothetical protein